MRALSSSKTSEYSQIERLREQICEQSKANDENFFAGWREALQQLSDDEERIYAGQRAPHCSVDALIASRSSSIKGL